MESRGKKQKKQKGGVGKSENKRLKITSEAKKQSKFSAEGVQIDGVRVKARRGQATDSHSLAERARREKISMRMKLLQSLVPGCDQITGKAHILDEIIKYVQLLQNQVECLAATLAFVDLMVYDCELNPSTSPCASAQQRLCCFEPQMPSSSVQFRSMEDAGTSTSASLYLTEDQKASLILEAQGGGNFLLDMNNQYFEDPVNQPAGLNNSCTF